MFFQTKKIQAETLPEYLKEVRLHLGMSINEVAKKTGIGSKVLKDLEAGLYNQLPSEVYIKGFFSQLAVLYGTNKQELIDQFEKERQIAKNIGHQALKAKGKKNFLSDVVITPKSLSVAGAIIFVVGTVVYIVWQVFAISQVPTLKIETPKDLTVIEKSFVEVIGETDRSATVTVNNEPVFVGQDGKFKTQLGVSAGPKELVVVAKNRFNKTTSKTLTIIGQSPQNIPEKKIFRLDLEFIKEVDIVIKIDGGKALFKTFKPGDAEAVEATREVLLSASNAGGVRLKLNGQNLGLLGRDGERLTDIPFSAQSGNINK